jgi:flagellum-specific peptidoglycan hydrolase FlgJ
MPSGGRPWWQQATALVSLGAGGAITGFTFVPRPAADLTSPSSMPVGLMALERSAQPAQAADDALRSAIINVANYYLRMAQTKTPAEMEAIIWQQDSLDGVDHGESCAAFASLTLELGAHVVGQQSWATGGSTYPWPLHKWADARVNPNPGSPGVTSIVQDAQTHQRWHAMGDGYQPQPGDWVVFDGHVEVVTKYAGGVLDTIGGDSVPNFSVNAHQYGDALSGQGVLGFVDNGDLPATTAAAAPGDAAPPSGAGQQGQEAMAIPGTMAAGQPSQQQTSTAADAVIPGTADAPAPATAALAPSPGKPHRPGGPGQPRRRSGRQSPGHVSHRPESRERAVSSAAAKAGAAASDLPGAGGWARAAMADTAAIPGLPMMAHRLAGQPAAPAASPYRRHSSSPMPAPGQGTSAQQAFIGAVAPAAVAAQRRYGVPASVTIAQAIDESGWGQSSLAVNEHNLFGIKGTGPAGSYQQLTQEYENGQLITAMSSFRVYGSAAQSVDDHGKLLATSGYYRRAMAVRGNPNSFAASLTGVYATDPEYGAKLVRLMQQYDLYRYDSIASDAARSTAAPQSNRSGTPPAANTRQPVSGQATSPAAQETNPAGPGTAPAGWAMGTPPTSGAWIPGTSIPGAGGSSGSVPAGSIPAQAGAAAGASAPAAGATPAPSAGVASGSAPRAGSQAAAPQARRGRAAQTGSSRPGGAPAAPSAPGTSPLRTSTGARSAQGTATTTRLAPGAAAAGRPQTTTAPGRRPVARASTPTRRAAPKPTKNGPVAGSANIPGVAAPGSGGPTQAASPAASSAPTARPGGRAAAAAGRTDAAPSTNAVSARLLAADVSSRPPRTATRPAPARAEKYRPQMPQTVRNAYVTRAKDPLLQAEPLYRDVAEHSGVRWQLLAACDWMQCRASAKYSPVHGEKLGTVNNDGSSYRTKSEALEQCAEELAALAWTVYGLDLAARRYVSVRDLAKVFAAFRWGGLLRRHRTSAMEFPYSVAGLTGQHLKMRWPNIDEPRAPDKPGGRFRMPFGAVPVVLFLNYPATV